MTEYDDVGLVWLYPRHLGGGARNRAPETEESYRVRYRWLHERASRELLSSVGPYQLARYVAGLAPILRASAFRQYIASIIQLFRDLAEIGKLDIDHARAAARELRDVEKKHRAGNNRQGKPDRCGSGRSKSLTLSDRKRLVAACSRRKSKSARILANVLAFGPLLGLRPHEWPGTTIAGDRLFVPSAKFSVENGRGLQPVRELRLDRSIFTPSAIAHLSQFFQFLDDELANCRGDIGRLMRRPARLLADIRRGASVPNITLKTTRHQARSNFVSDGVSTGEIAALLGHASAATAATHYGMRRGGWGVKVGVSAEAEVIGMVRKVRSSVVAPTEPDTPAFNRPFP